MHHVLHFLNVSYILKPLGVVSDWGKTPPTGLLKQLWDGDFDTMAMWYRIVEARLEYFEYGFPMPYQYLTYGFILQQRGHFMRLESAGILHKVSLDIFCQFFRLCCIFIAYDTNILFDVVKSFQNMNAVSSTWRHARLFIDA